MPRNTLTWKKNGNLTAARHAPSKKVRYTRYYRFLRCAFLSVKQNYGKIRPRRAAVVCLPMSNLFSISKILSGPVYGFKYCLYIYIYLYKFIYLFIHPFIATFSDHNVAASHKKRLTGPKKHARLQVPETRFAPSTKDESRFGVTAKRVAARRADRVTE